MNILGNRNMEYVAALAQHQSISKAADALYISQPALSRYIHTLESNLNIKLFNRISNKFLLTYEGEKFMHYAQQINYLCQQLETEIADIAAEGQGRLRIAVPMHRSSVILPNVLPEFYRMYPKVEIKLWEVASNQQEKLLTEGEVDCAISIESMKHPDIMTIPIHQDRALLAVPENHRLFSQGEKNLSLPCPTIKIDELRDDNFILPFKGQRTRKVADEVFAEAHIQPNILLCTRSIETMLGLVCQGMGICVVNSTYAKKLPQARPLSFFNIDSSLAVVSICITYMRNSYMPSYFSDFVWLVQQAVN